MRQLDLKKLLIPNLPYLLIGLYATKLGEAWRLAPGADASAKLLGLMDGFAAAFQSALPSFHPVDLLVGLCCGAALRLAVYIKGKNAKKYRKNMEYGSARWGTAEDIKPFMDPVFENNIILTQTERLTMNSRPKDPRTARNKNVLIIGGSGSGKTRFWLKPNLMQCTSKTYPTSFVVTDPKGSILIECGKMLQKFGYAIGAETTDLSTLYMNNSLYCTSKLVYENLVDFDNGEIVPGLAESWEYNDDQTELTFHLRQGVTFHNGEPFNAEAVKTNLEHKQSNPSFYSLKGITDIQEIEVVDEYTITLHYDHPFYAYLQDFCWPDVNPMSAPEYIIPGDFQTISGVAGTGPYIYDEYVAGEYTRFVRNEDYWGETPYWDEIIVKYIPDSTSRLQALQTGEIDMIYGGTLLTYEEYDQALAMDGIDGQMAEKDTRVQVITTNATSPYLSDIRVRQAIAYAIDKEEMSVAISNGYEPPADIPATRDTPYADVELETTYDYDPDMANQLLDEAGWLMNESTGIREKDGEPLSLLLTLETGSTSVSMPTAEVIKSQLAEVGIDITIYGTEQMQWYADYLEGKFDLTLWHCQYAFASPHCWFTPMDSMVPQTPSLPGIEGSDEFLATIKELTNMSDDQEVRDTYTYLFNYDVGNVLDIPLTYQKDMLVYNTDKIAGYTFTGTPCFFDILSLEPAE